MTRLSTRIHLPVLGLGLTPGKGCGVQQSIVPAVINSSAEQKFNRERARKHGVCVCGTLVLAEMNALQTQLGLVES